jgi:quercetin dioxygenase-like cupin family protein
MSDYFATDDVERADDAVGSFGNIAEEPEVEAAPGVKIRAIAHGTLMLSYVRLEPNSVAATHLHSEEQMGIVLEGECVFDLDGTERTLGTNDVYHAPAGVPHGARTGAEPCVILDVFSPPRVALLDLIARATKG